MSGSQGMDRYTKGAVLGQGTYGKVVKAVDNEVRSSSTTSTDGKGHRNQEDSRGKREGGKRDTKYQISYGRHVVVCTTTTRAMTGRLARTAAGCSYGLHGRWSVVTARLLPG
eukprot:7173826-Pyramimonas_sp.AAC.1